MGCSWYAVGDWFESSEMKDISRSRHTHIKSKLGFRRWNQRSSISQGLKVFKNHKEYMLSLQKMINGSCSCKGWLSCDNNVIKHGWFCFGSVQVSLVGAWEELFLIVRKKSEKSPSWCGWYRLYLHEETTRARAKCVKAYTRLCWSKWLFVATTCSSFSEIVRVTRKKPKGKTI